jgi:microcystin-dependent protein
MTRTAIESGAYLTEQPAWVPKGFMLPMGQRLLRSEYPGLFAAIGTTYGCDGPLTFRMPFWQPERTPEGFGPIVQLIAVDDDAVVTPPGTIVLYFHQGNDI